MLARAGQRGRVPSYAGSERAASERAGQRTCPAYSAQISQRRAAGNRPAQTIPGIGQPVLHRGHPSPPDPVQAAAPGCLAFFPDDPAGTPVTGKRAHPPAHRTDRLPGRGRRDCVRVRSGLLWRGRPAPLTAIPAQAILDLALPGRHGFGAHPGSGLLERIFPALELLWFLLAALRLTPGQPSRACTPATTGPAVPPAPPKASHRDPDPPAPATSGWSQPQRVCCVSPGENLGG
jgi:hypothetical protein